MPRTWREWWNTPTGRAWRRWLLPASLVLAAVLAMCWRLWTPLGERKDFGIDSQWGYWGQLKFQLDAYRAGELPLWNPFDRCGYPFYADPQCALLYPVTWLLLAIGAIAGGIPFWIMNLENVFHLWLAAFGLFFYLRRRQLPDHACYAGALVLVLSSPFLHHFDLNLNWSMAWAPWLLAAIDAWAERPTHGRAAWAALAASMCFLAGAMPTCWYTVVIAVPYAAWAVVHHGRTGGAAYRRAALRSAAVGAALLAAIVLAQLTATSAYVPDTVRANRDLEFVAGTQFTSVDLVGFFVPRLTRLNHYLGAAAILWIGTALVVRPTTRTLVLAALAGFGILCAWGRGGAVLPVVASVLPPFRLFRYAMRYSYVAIVPLALLAAEGLTTLSSLSGDERRRASWVILGAGALAAVVFGIGFVVQTGDARAPYGSAFAAFLVGTWATWQLLACEPARARRFGVLAVCLLAADLFVGHAEAIERNLVPLTQTPHDAEVQKLDGIPDGQRRVFDRAYAKYRPGSRLGIRDFAGYEDDPLNLTRYQELKDALEGHPDRLGHANIGWMLTERGVQRVADVAPAVMWIGRPQIAADEQAAIAALVTTRPGTAAILERASAPPEAAAAHSDAPPIAGHLDELARDHLTATIDAPDAGVVVIHETFSPGWSATVDGADAPIFPANGLFRGLWVGAGHHTIAMRFHAPAYLALALLELVGFAGAAFVIVRERRRAKS